MNANATPRTNRELLATLPVGTVAKRREWYACSEQLTAEGWKSVCSCPGKSLGCDYLDEPLDGPNGIVVISRPDAPEPAKAEPAKLLSLREAWLWLAEKWDGAESDGHVSMIVLHRCYGLCPCIGTMTTRRLISRDTADEMRQSIAALPNYLSSYKFPTDAAGARARAAFCREQAAKLEPKAEPAPAPSAESPDRPPPQDEGDGPFEAIVHNWQKSCEHTKRAVELLLEFGVLTKRQWRAAKRMASK